MQIEKDYVALDRLINMRRRLGQKIITTTHGPVEEYLMWKETHSKTAFKAYRIWVERFQSFVGKDPEKLELSDITMFMRMIQAVYSPKNVEYGMNIIYNYLRFWKEQGKLSLPLYLVKVPTAIANSHNAITEDEYQQMLAALQEYGIFDLRNQCIIRLLHDTGMRVGELCALNIEDMEEGTAVIKTEKTTRKRRVFWTDETARVVKKYMIARTQSCQRAKLTSALFIGLKGNFRIGISSRSVERMVKEVVRLAGIDRVICPHSFRHGFIHRLAKKGVPDAIIALLVGHSTPHTIAHYTKLSRLEIEETYRKIFGDNEWGEGSWRVKTLLPLRSIVH